MNMNEPVVLLVDSISGIYAWHKLATNYPLYVFMKKGHYKPLNEWIRARADFTDDIEHVFHPDHNEWLENIEYLTTTESISVLSESGEYWDIDQIDGDIFAVNPRAEWNNSTEQWEIK